MEVTRAHAAIEITAVESVIGRQAQLLQRKLSVTGSFMNNCRRHLAPAYAMLCNGTHAHGFKLRTGAPCFSAALGQSDLHAATANLVSK
eukprot:852468-Pelagomonas_calceolata.AAC.1